MTQRPLQPAQAARTPPKETIDRQGDLSPAQTAKLATVPRRYRPITRRAWLGKSRKAAIKAFCIACCGYSIEETRRCSAPLCALFPFRESG